MNQLYKIIHLIEKDLKYYGKYILGSILLLAVLNQYIIMRFLHSADILPLIHIFLICIGSHFIFSRICYLEDSYENQVFLIIVANKKGQFGFIKIYRVTSSSNNIINIYYISWYSNG